MNVALLQVLAHWHEQGHKALLFTQTQQMLDILEGAVQAGTSACDGMPPSATVRACMPPPLLLVHACNQGHRLQFLKLSASLPARCLHSTPRVPVSCWNSHAASGPAHASSSSRSLLRQAPPAGGLGRLFAQTALVMHSCSHVPVSLHHPWLGPVPAPAATTDKQPLVSACLLPLL